MTDFRSLWQYQDRPGDFVLNILHFARQLKEAGLPVTIVRTLDALRGLELIDFQDKEEMYTLLSSHFVSRPEELAVFGLAFEEFWCLKASPKCMNSNKHALFSGNVPLTLVSEGDAQKPNREVQTPAYSFQEDLKKKDFAQVIDQESEDVYQVIKALAQNLGLRLGRRWRAGKKGGRIDLRHSIRSSLRHGGELPVLNRKRRRPRKTRFVVLRDVSGSMDSYSRFLPQFMYGFQMHVPQVETFVFSTRLTRITPLLKMRKIEAAYRLISEKVLDWSGGTRIGSSLSEYNKRYGRKYSGPNTVVILLSDGWDQGEIELLDREMRKLKSQTKRLMWLNPLLGMPDYRPIDRGMKTSLPYIEDFLDCHDLEQLEEFGRKLEKAL